MGLFSGPRQPQPPRTEQRSVWPGVPLTDFDFATLANPEVSASSASQSVAIRSSIDLIASMMSELPIHVYRGDGNDRQSMKTPGNLQDPGDDGYGLQDWIYRVAVSWLYRGNAYGREVSWYPNGNASQVEILHPDDVSVSVDSGKATWRVNGEPVPRPDLFVHDRVNPQPGRLLGLSPIAEHATVVGTTLAASKYGNQWFRDGAHPSSLLVNSEATIDAETASVVKQRWLGLFRGTREPAVLGRGWEYKPISVTAEESQFLQTLRYSEAQCARIFGPAMAEVLGYETGGSMTYANVVDRRADLLALTLDRWFNRIERLLSSLLPRPQYVRIDRDALLRSATLSRYEAHAKALQNAWKTVNEVRDDEDMAPVPWGDEPTGITTPAGGSDGNTAGL